ncbi:hypothetical protein [Nocardioides sp. MH1]|uniref:hypothetical protein n=1 Tax=Nocardioides sp. MH1 TaxID=3242490 RepID=UPI00352005D5
MTSAYLRRLVLGSTALLLLVLGLVAAPSAQAATDPGVAQARNTYLAAVADDDAAVAALATATTGRDAARDNVASALGTLRSATASYLADPTPSTRDARYVANYQLGDAKMAYSQARLDYASARDTRVGTLAARQSALAAYRAALGG